MIQRYLKILSYGIKLSKLYLVLRIFQLILSSASSAFSLLLPKMLLNAIATKNLKTVLIILSLSFFVSTINSLIDRFLSPKLSWLREKINAKIVDNFLQKSINLDLEYFDQPDAYDKYTIAFERCCAIVQGAFDILLSFISSLLQIGLVVYVLSWISPVVLLVFLTVCALQTYINNLIQLDNYKYQKFMNQHNRKLNYLYRLFYIPEFMRDIRANDIMRFIFTKKQKVTEKVLSDTYSTNQKVSTKNLIIAILSAIESFATMLYFSLEVVWQRIWYDDFVVSLSAYNRLKSAFSQIISNFVSLSTNDLYIKDYLSFMETASNVVCGRRQLISIDLVEFRNVSFRYPNVDGNALDTGTLSSPAVGTIIKYYSRTTSSFGYGSVERRNVTVVADDRDNISGLTEVKVTSGSCESGDSGGPFFQDASSGAKYCGVLHGKRTDSSGNLYVFFTPYTYISSAGFSVRTN